MVCARLSSSFFFFASFKKVLPCSIPVNVTSNNNTPMVVSTVIPSSLSYSSSCTASATPESLRKRTPISVPIQITKTKENNHHTQTNGVSTTTINNNNNYYHHQQQHPNIINGSPRGYRYIQKQPQYLSPPTSTRTKNNIQPLTLSSVNQVEVSLLCTFVRVQSENFLCTVNET